MVVEKYGRWMRLHRHEHAKYGEWAVWLEGDHTIEIGERIAVLTNAGKVLQVEVAAIVAEGVQKSTGVPFKILATTGKRFYGPPENLIL